MASPPDGTGPGAGAGEVVGGGTEGAAVAGEGDGGEGEEEGEGEGEEVAVLISPPKPVYPLVPTAVNAHWLMESSTQAGPVIQNSDSPGTTIGRR